MIKVNVRTDKGNSVPSQLTNENRKIEDFLASVGVPVTSATQIYANGQICDADTLLADIDAEEVTLMLCEKMQLGAKMHVAGHALALTSEYLDIIKDAATHKPEALVVRDPETKEPVFKVEVAEGDEYGDIGKYGVTFSNKADSYGNAVATTVLNLDMFDDPYVQDIREKLVQEYGPVLANLQKVEEQIEKARGELEAQVQATEGMIVIAH